MSDGLIYIMPGACVQCGTPLAMRSEDIDISDMRCPECGYELAQTLETVKDGRARFCWRCGTELAAAAERCEKCQELLSLTEKERYENQAEKSRQQGDFLQAISWMQKSLSLTEDIMGVFFLCAGITACYQQTYSLEEFGQNEVAAADFVKHLRLQVKAYDAMERSMQELLLSRPGGPDIEGIRVWLREMDA